MSKRDAAIFDEILLTMTQIPLGLSDFVQKFVPKFLSRSNFRTTGIVLNERGDEKPCDYLMIPA
ncbi:hypothetical protein [Candidatus Binatus sp.]|uniref:hypothetical protein n=1 Tax=Candidatus Binatus sp. TaxID=2811406 RepID=UPI002F95D257